MSPASPTPKILEKEGPQPPQIPPHSAGGGDTGEREEPHPRAAQAALGEGLLVSGFFGVGFVCFAKKNPKIAEIEEIPASSCAFVTAGERGSEVERGERGGPRPERATSTPK